MKETVYGISGLGDVIATAMSSLSRNWQAGNLLAAGNTASHIEKNLIPTAIESFSALQALPFLIQNQESHHPILSTARDIYTGKKSAQSIKDMM